MKRIIFLFLLLTVCISAQDYRRRVFFEDNYKPELFIRSGYFIGSFATTSVSGTDTIPYYMGRTSIAASRHFGLTSGNGHVGQAISLSIVTSTSINYEPIQLPTSGSTFALAPQGSSGTLIVSFYYRTNVNNFFRFAREDYNGSNRVTAYSCPINTGDARYVSFVVSYTNGFTFRIGCETSGNTGDWFEVSNLSIK